jgi:hypothetical protein
MIIRRWTLLRMRNILVIFLEKIRTHVLYSITFLRKSCRLWDNVEKYGTAGQTTDDNIIRRMRFACWINKATATHSEYVIFVAFPRRQCLRDPPEYYVCTYIACLLVHNFCWNRFSPWQIFNHLYWCYLQKFLHCSSTIRTRRQMLLPSVAQCVAAN